MSGRAKHDFAEPYGAGRLSEALAVAGGQRAEVSVSERTSWAGMTGIALAVALLTLRLPWADWTDRLSVPDASTLRQFGLFPIAGAAIVSGDHGLIFDVAGATHATMECLGFREIQLPQSRRGWIALPVPDGFPDGRVFVDDVTGLEDGCARWWRLTLHDAFIKGEANFRY